MKKVILFFDFEERWGMPFEAVDYDIIKITRYLLGMLQKYKVKAVFFVVGKIIEEHPDLIEEIARDGHEIALHGYDHEHLDKLTKKELVKFGANLARIGNLLEKITGKRPAGFRAPFLESPKLNMPLFSNILKQQGYVWISSQSIRHEREFLRPGRLPLAGLLMASKTVRKLLFILLNWRFVFTDSIDSASCTRVVSSLRWLLGGTPPFKKNGLVEIRAHAPFDCELVGLPRPTEPTPQILLDYAVDTLVKNASEAKGSYSITFHDWIVGSNNRTQILERVLLQILKDKSVKFILPNELI